MLKNYILSIFCAVLPLLAISQEYHSPLDIPLTLSSNFGEIRANHFHSGVDFKTEGVIGKNVYAVEKGYVSRVYVSPSGFGHALYVSHPAKGTTSVYAHLQSFSPEIEAYVKKHQYAKKSFYVNLFPTKDMFPVERGEIIAKSGNTGSSGGPHLHFELRNSAAMPYNIIAKDIYSINDNIAPSIHSVSLVRVDTVKGVPVHTTYKTIKTQKLGSNYKLTTDTLDIAAPSYFVIEVSERKNGTTNIYGIYSMDVKRNNEPYFSFAIDKFSFGNTRYVNSICKFPETNQNRNDKFRTYISPNNKLNVYSDVKSRGIIKPTSINGVEPIFVEVSDDSNNKTTLSFCIRESQNKQKVNLNYSGTPVWWKKGANLKENGITVEIPAEALYESELVSIVKLPKTEKTLTNRFKVGNSDVKLQKPITLTLNIDSVKVENKSKLTIVSVSGSKIYSLGGNVSGSNIIAKTSNFGEFSLAYDNIAPRITPLYDAQKIQSRKISFKISDNLSGIGYYTATINGKWALLEYDSKTATISHPLSDGIAQKGENTIVVTVGDTKGNAKTYKGVFKH